MLRCLRPFCLRLAQCLMALSAWVLPVASMAQNATAENEFSKDVQRWVEGALGTEQGADKMPLRTEVVVGALDSRLRLAPCAKVETYLPPGTRLWGRTRIGIRCVDGSSRWSVFLPVTVKAFGKAWVLQSNVAAGTLLGPTDAVEAEVDWADDNSPVVLDARQWVGSQASRHLSAGQTIRQSAVRAPNVFSAGTQVRVLAQGNGFQVATEAQALAAGVVGQSVRLRMDNGRILSGIVLDARTVKLEP